MTLATKSPKVRKILPMMSPDVRAKYRMIKYREWKAYRKPIIKIVFNESSYDYIQWREIQLGEIRECLDKVLHTLTEREELVLRMSFGLDDGKSRTLIEVAEAFNITCGRVRQITAKAIQKMRHPTRSKDMRDVMNGYHY